MELSYYGTVELSNCRTIEPSDYRSDPDSEHMPLVKLKRLRSLLIKCQIAVLGSPQRDFFVIYWYP